MARSFDWQGCVAPLGDDLPEFRRKVVGVARQPLIKRTVRFTGRLFGRLLVLRCLTLVLFQFGLKITRHGHYSTRYAVRRQRMVASRSDRNDDWLKAILQQRCGSLLAVAYGHLGRRVGSAHWVTI